MKCNYLTFYLFLSSSSGKTCQLSFRRMMKSTISLTSQPISAAVGDLHNDIQIDIVVANSGTNTIGIFLSNVNGTFANQ